LGVSFAEARELVAWASDRLVIVQGLYEACLTSQEITTPLKMETKGLVENLRSALDYCARELHTRYCPPTAKYIHFPIARVGDKEASFTGRVAQNIPGLPTANPKLVETLASFQEFRSRSNAWLPHLATVANDVKHVRLTIQTASERRALHLQSAAGVPAIVLDEGFTLNIAPGAAIYGNVVNVPGPQTISVERPPKMALGEAAVVVRWVSIDFEKLNVPVVDLVGTAIEGVARVINTLEDAGGRLRR
jgi:hypothetical protein